MPTCPKWCPAAVPQCASFVSCSKRQTSLGTYSASIVQSNTCSRGLKTWAQTSPSWRSWKDWTPGVSSLLQHQGADTPSNCNSRSCWHQDITIRAITITTWRHKSSQPCFLVHQWSYPRELQSSLTPSTSISIVQVTHNSRIISNKYWAHHQHWSIRFKVEITQSLSTIASSKAWSTASTSCNYREAETSINSSNYCLAGRLFRIWLPIIPMHHTISSSTCTINNCRSKISPAGEKAATILEFNWLERPTWLPIAPKHARRWTNLINCLFL